MLILSDISHPNNNKGNFKTLIQSQNCSATIANFLSFFKNLHDNVIIEEIPRMVIILEITKESRPSEITKIEECKLIARKTLKHKLCDLT